jgi:hypothetical protein
MHPSETNAAKTSAEISLVKYSMAGVARVAKVIFWKIVWGPVAGVVVRVAANTHIEPEIDMIQIMDVGN